MNLAPNTPGASGHWFTANEASVCANTVTLGVAGRLQTGTQPLAIHVASFLLQPAASYSLAFNYSLATWDSYNNVIGTGFWDSFSISVTGAPYAEVVTSDPIDVPLGTGLGFLWGGTSWTDGQPETTTGTHSVTLPGNANGDNYLNVVLDTLTPVDADGAFPSWGTFTFTQLPRAQFASISPPKNAPVWGSDGVAEEADLGMGGDPAADGFSEGGIRYFDGAVALAATDLASDGFGTPWGQGRFWTNLPGHAAGGANGNGVVDEHLPRLHKVYGLNRLAVVTSGTDARFFDLIDGQYRPYHFLQDTLAYNSAAAEYVLTDSAGNRLRFYGFDAPTAAQRGAFKSFTDPSGNLTEVFGPLTGDGRPTGVRRSVTVGRVATVESYAYTYLTSGPNVGLLSNVKLQRSVGGAMPFIVRQVDYTYYDGTLPFGTARDLRTAVIKDGAGTALGTWYYRYYTAGLPNGYPGALWHVFDPPSFARLAAVTDPFSANEGQVLPYPSRSYEYDAERRVSKVTLQRAGNAPSTGLGTFTYSYATSAFCNDYNAWKYKTTETLPDGSQNIVYANFAGLTMLHAFVSGQSWMTFTKYDDQGRVVLRANPSAVRLYDQNKADLLDYNSVTGNYLHLDDNVGLVETFSYHMGTTATATVPGGAAGYLHQTYVQRGELGTVAQGTAALQSTTQYYVRTGATTVYPVATQTIYRNADGSGGQTTSFGYTWYNGTTRAESVTVVRPVVSAIQNGPGTADVETTVFDPFGRPVWRRDGGNFLHYTAYDQATGAVTTALADVNTALGGFTGLPLGWVTPPGGGLHLLTQVEVDPLGRATKVTAPNTNVTYLVYKDPGHEVRVYPGWQGTIPTGPTQVYREDWGKGYNEWLTMSATPDAPDDQPTGAEAVSDLQTLSRAYANTAWQVTHTDAYHNLANLAYTTSTNLGTVNTHFYRTLLSYDDRGRRSQEQTPTNTIYKTVYDGLSRVTSSQVGTTTLALTTVAAHVYDGGGVGDSNRTQSTAYPGGGAPNRVTQSFYDWRNRPVATKDGVEASENEAVNRPILYSVYNNLSQVTRAQHYDGDTVTITSSGGVPQPPAASRLRAQGDTYFDEQGSVYRTETFSVNPSTGAVGSDVLWSKVWYDHRRQVTKTTEPGLHIVKRQYDGAGRVTKTSVTDGGGDSAWYHADDVEDDAVLTQTETRYDKAGNPTLVITKDRFHDETATGALGYATMSPKARRSFQAFYYDLANRLTNTEDVGTFGGNEYNPSGSPPSGSSDAFLVNSVDYNAAGWPETTTDPRDVLNKTFYDNLGRVTKTVEAFVDGTPGSGDHTVDKTTEFLYDVVTLRTTVKALLAGGDTQETQTVYGVTTAGGSGVNSNDLASAVFHPHKTGGAPSDTEDEVYQVTAFGEPVRFTDRRDNVHTYAYDVLGRPVSDAVTTLMGPTDNAVLRRETAYDGQGNPYLFTSYSAATGGTVVNQVQRAFNGLGQLITEYQSHNLAVNTTTTPKVQYAYTEMAGGNNHSRPTAMTYPNGRVLNSTYAGGADDYLSRVSSLADSSNTFESYSYLGLGTVVRRGRPLPGVDLTYVQQSGDAALPADTVANAGDQYTGLDRFGRVRGQRWRLSGGSHTDRFGYGHDKNSNPQYRENLVNTSFSELYHAGGAAGAYDKLNQLPAFARGTLNAAKDTIAAPARSQSWAYDGQGNWSTVTTDLTPVSRTHNRQNQITSGGVTYDADGNLTADGGGKTFVYDAWNRLRRVEQGMAVLASYGYDALGRRVVEAEGGVTRDLYYSAAWQVLEEHAGGQIKAQYVWSPVYVDALVLRDRDADGDGSLEERLWVQQDANYNVTALVNGSGTVVERYVYDPYGAVTVLSPTWATLGGSGYGWQYLHQGGRYSATTGLYNFRYRDYAPTLGRWLATDPIGFGAGDTNLYRAVGNNPAGALDPSGLLGWKFYLWEAPIAFGQGAWHGATQIAGGAKDFAVQAAYTGYDLARASRQLGSVGWNTLRGTNDVYLYEPSSALFGGLDQAAKRGEGVAYVTNAAADFASFGTKPLGESLYAAAATGDVDQFSRNAGGFAAGLFGAKAVGKAWSAGGAAYRGAQGYVRVSRFAKAAAADPAGFQGWSEWLTGDPFQVSPQSVKGGPARVVPAEPPAPPPNPQAYSVAFEMQLPTSVLGRRRTVHFNRANAALDAALAADPQFARMVDGLMPGVRSSVSRVGGRHDPTGWTWEHVHSTQAGGQVGVMRLVPTPQHTPGSPWWRVLHPQPGATGGYSEWAIPRGAPPN